MAIVQGAHRSEFEYDGMSRRLDAPCGCTAIVEIENGTVESRKLYWWRPGGNASACGGTIVCERDGLQPGFPITKRYFGQGVEDNGVKLYYTLDHLGSVQELTDETGVVVADYHYTIYGERTKSSGPQDSDFGFAGLFHHAPSGLDLATYRLYDSRQRRFISRDPLGEAVDYNLYRYANNNPINFVDPTGENPWEWVVGGGLTLPGYAAYDYASNRRPSGNFRRDLSGGIDRIRSHGYADEANVLQTQLDSGELHLGHGLFNVGFNNPVTGNISIFQTYCEEDNSGKKRSWAAYKVTLTSLLFHESTHSGQDSFSNLMLGISGYILRNKRARAKLEGPVYTAEKRFLQKWRAGTTDPGIRNAIDYRIRIVDLHLKNP